MQYSKFVHNFLEDSAKKFPERPAFFVNNQWYTYQEIEQQVNQLAHVFLKQGIQRGDRIAFYLDNSIEYVVTYYAVLKTGAVTVALNTENLADSISYIIEDCDVKAFIISTKLFRKIQDVFKKDTTPPLYVWNAPKTFAQATGTDPILLPATLETESTTPPDVKIIDLDVASIVYTSGSTGKPRGATLSHLNIVTNTRSIVEYLELTPDDRVAVVLPFYYIYGKSLLNTHFFVGGSVVADNRFLYPNVVLKTMQEQQVTGFSGVPSTFTILLNRSNLRALDFPSLRYVTQAGGAMAPAVQKEVAEIFSPAQLYIMYGATEASARLSYLPPEDLQRKWGSIGFGIPNVDLFIADSKGNRQPSGVQGEIVAKGANIMSGYWNHPEETKKVLKHGLYYTGDLGVMDEEGFLFVVGRSKDMIKIGGNRASAKEIEDVIYEHPLVAETAVVGVTDDLMGEVPKAFIVLKDNKNSDGIEEELNAFLNKKIAQYKIPKYYDFRDSLPKNKSGKIQKLKLK